MSSGWSDYVELMCSRVRQIETDYIRLLSAEQDPRVRGLLKAEKALLLADYESKVMLLGAVERLQESSK